jgi:CheY-like chemotaxis protein
VSPAFNLERRRRVLVVDDKRHNRGWLMEILVAVGFRVREAESGEAALRVWQEFEPDLVLMDIRMPGMGGLEASRRIRASANGKQPVIIAVSASAWDEDRRSVVGDGAVDDFLPKPFREADLMEKIRVHLGLTYVYAEQEKAEGVEPAVAPARGLNPGLLQGLPVELRSQLHDAVLAGDKSGLDGIIRRIGECEKQTAEALQELADRYEYDALIHCLSGIPGEAEKTKRVAS